MVVNRKYDLEYYKYVTCFVYGRLSLILMVSFVVATEALARVSSPGHLL